MKSMRVLKKIAVFVFCVSTLLWITASFTQANQVAEPITEASLLNQLQQDTDNTLRISYHNETGKVRFIGALPENLISQPSLLSADASPEDAARGFLNSYGVLFGIANPESDLTLMKERVDDNGRSAIRFQQTHQGIPVIGGELIVQLSSNQDILAATGEILPNVNVEVTPSVEANLAAQTAIDKVAKQYGMQQAELEATTPELWIYSPSIMGGPGLPFNRLVWRTEVTGIDVLHIREFVLIDAHLGAVALSFSQIHAAKDRETYDANNGTTLPGTLRCDESNPSCTGGDSHEIAAHTFAGDTYDFFMDEHGRDSIDDAGMTMISTVHYSSGFVNAFWNGTQMVYGDGAGFPLADDVVGHELAHGVTEHESGLFYFYQSGAINESFSDLWGEFVDLFEATGNDTGDTRWEMGEDISGIGAIRNMQDPTLFGDPDKMSSVNYYCQQSDLSTGAGDNGGVHVNSGINNKAVYLMTDGGTFNGYTVTGLGYAKVADLYYEVQTNLLTSASDYGVLYDALIQASINLGFSASEQQEVRDALHAVEMNQFPTGCAATETPICTSGTPANIFFDDIESGGGQWTTSSNLGEVGWFVPQTSAGLGLDGPYATSGVGNIWGFDQGDPIGGESDTSLEMNSSVTLPADAFMHFNHSFGFESDSFENYDGGIVEYSTNGGSSWSNAGALFTHNGYNRTLASHNPLGGIAAFAADSGGYMSSRLDLSSLAGQNVRFRFRLGTDEFVYDYGWFIDDVRIYTCDGEGPTVDDHFIYLPFVSTPLAARPGFWQTGDSAASFYVTPNSSHVDEFAINVNVTGCGVYTITRTAPVPITNNQFSFTGNYYASGNVNSETAASGTVGLSNYNIAGCGLVNGGPWTWNATWQNGSQPIILSAQLIVPDILVEQSRQVGASVYTAVIAE